jgi:maleylacetoacetate isomerase
MNDITLFDFWRSSASYRVRIVLNLKRVAYKTAPTNLVEGVHKRHDLTQSLAIIDYLDAKYPEPPMVSSDPAERAKTLAQALVIAADIHPVNNLRILKYLGGVMGQDQAAVDDWYRHWVIEGLTALEAMAPEDGLFGGARPNLADVCLVPQMYNARRFDTPMEAFPKLVRMKRCAGLRPLRGLRRRR